MGNRGTCENHFARQLLCNCNCNLTTKIIRATNFYVCNVFFVDDGIRKQYRSRETHTLSQFCSARVPPAEKGRIWKASIRRLICDAADLLEAPETRKK